MLTHKLLYSIISESDLTTLGKVKDLYLPKNDLTIFEFIRTYHLRYNKFPDILTVEQKFKIQLPVTTDKPEFWLDEVVLRYKDNLLSGAVIDAAKNKDSALKIFQDTILAYNVDVGNKVTLLSDTSADMTRYAELKLSGGITYTSTGSADIDDLSLGFKRCLLYTSPSPRDRG